MVRQALVSIVTLGALAAVASAPASARPYGWGHHGYWGHPAVRVGVGVGIGVGPAYYGGPVYAGPAYGSPYYYGGGAYYGGHYYHGWRGHRWAGRGRR